MAVEVEIDVELLKSEISKTYASVSEEPGRDFMFPTGRSWAEDLHPAELASVPDAAVESFAGVANPWELGRLAPGERVLDLGSGAGTDSLVAAQMVGEQGHVTGIDMTPEMLAKARAAAAEMGASNVEFVESEAERLPFPEAAYARLLEWHGFERIETGLLVDTYARSKFEDTRRKAQKFGARGTTIKAYKPSV